MATPYRVLATCLVVVALVLAACGGDPTATPAPPTPTATPAEAAPAYDIARADTIAHDALPTEGDLPGTGWTVESTDDFSDDDLGDSEACQRAAAARDLNKTDRDADRAGRAQIEFETTTPSTVPLSVNASVNVFKSAEVPRATVDNFLAAVHAGDMIACVKDNLLASLPAGATIDIVETAQHVQPPHRGIAFAWQLNILAGDERLAVALEYQVWADSNAGVALTFLGPPDAITMELVQGAVSAVDQKLTAGRRP